MPEIVYVGINGGVLALDRDTGEMRWHARLKGSGFVTVLLDGDRVLAATRGEIYCLAAATGGLLWHNKLPSMGFGLVSIATVRGSLSPVHSQIKRYDETPAAE